MSRFMTALSLCLSLVGIIAVAAKPVTAQSAVPPPAAVVLDVDDLDEDFEAVDPTGPQTEMPLPNYLATFQYEEGNERTRVAAWVIQGSLPLQMLADNFAQGLASRIGTQPRKYEAPQLGDEAYAYNFTGTWQDRPGYGDVYAWRQGPYLVFVAVLSTNTDEDALFYAFLQEEKIADEIDD